jgi:hypothetical protein
MEKALDIAVDLYTVIGGLGILFVVYGLLWLIVSMVWKKIHSKSYDYVTYSIINALYDKKEEKDEDKDS